jgi:hypothetical protein
MMIGETSSSYARKFNVDFDGDNVGFQHWNVPDWLDE